MHLNPAEYVIHVLGGVRNTARIIGRHPSSVSKWQSYADKTGVIGNIPTSVQPLILKYAEENGLDLTAEDLISGRYINKRDLN